jgi:hypothetical protein
MPKVPVDLQCLDGCTTVNFITEYAYDDNTVYEAFPDCNNYPYGSFLGCYLTNVGHTDRNEKWSSLNYFDMAVESCVLAILQPDLYPNGNCDELGVNLFSTPQLNPEKKNLKNFGPASSELAAYAGLLNEVVYPIPLKNRYPWQCSLRTPGFTGVHRCGVTLISGPPGPTIFVSAAHCNYLCKTNLGLVVEVCCCLDKESKFSCQGSDFCGINPTYQLANPLDLQIACNLPIQEPLPHGLSKLNTAVLTIEEIRIHPSYQPLHSDTQTGGPAEGYDISVYIVDDSRLTLDPSFIWPACLPKQEEFYVKGNRGILSGWIAPVPLYHTVSSTTIRAYEWNNLWQSEALYERVPCADPAWMNSSSYYPKGTACYTDVAWASSVQFGGSGSGIVRPFLFSDATVNKIQYSWAGPLSFSKGSDHIVRSGGTGRASYVFTPFSSNPAVFTDALCYMDWVAAQYNLSLPAGYNAPQSCLQSSGNKEDANNANCLSRNIRLNETSNVATPCDFSQQKTCRLFAYNLKFQPATTKNFFFCKNIANDTAACANNCPGVDSNAVVVGGEAVLISVTASATVPVAAPSLLGPALGAGSILAMLGLGRVTMDGNRAACPPGQCRARLTRSCCRLVDFRGQQVCPFSCSLEKILGSQKHHIEIICSGCGNRVATDVNICTGHSSPV